MEIATAVIQTLTGEIIKIARSEAQYAWEFGAQLDEMKKKLEQANGLLEDKESLKHKNGYVKPILIQLREVIYEADDVLTDCLIRKEYNKHGCFNFIRQYDPFVLIQSGKKLKEINSQMNEHLRTLGKYLVKPDSSAAKGYDSQHEQLPSQNYNAAGIIGLESDVEKIKEWIFEPNKEFQSIAIVGMGGLGKTTLAQKIFNDITQASSDIEVIWVSVTKNFNKYRILTLMLKKLTGRTPRKLDSSNLMRELRQALERKEAKYLVVMDDVWSMDDVWWHDLRSTFTIPNRTSRIIITTRNIDVVEKMGVEDSRIHQPKILNQRESWLLFSICAFPSSKGICKDSQFEKLGGEIVDKCGGLPLSIKTIGSLLASKTRLATWTEVLESCHKSPIKGNDQVIESLRLSFNELEPHLKQCLLCFSIYPEDFEISAEQLIHWWVAEGLVQKKASEDAKTVLELGYECLSKLVNRCLVDVVERRGYDGRVYSCKIHDMVRELIITIAEEEAFCFFNKQGIQEWKKDSYWLGLTDEMELVSFGNNSKVRALLLLGSRKVDFDRNSGLLLSLRVLDLSGCSSLEEKHVKNLFDWISALKRLACLNLSEVKALVELPSSICKLLNLKLLVLNECTNLKKIHPSITNLNKLIVLHLGGCPVEYLPKGLERLSELQELTGFKVVGQTNSKACRLLELRKLSQLRLLQIVLRDDPIEISASELKKVLLELKNLKVLDIDADQCKNAEVFKMVDSLCPPESLRELYLRSFHRNRLPKWVNPTNLKKLQYLCIEDADITYLIPKFENDDCSNDSWEVLEGLCLKHLNKLELDWNEMKVMPSLKHVEVTHCYLLKNFPCDVQQTGIWCPRDQVEE